MATRADFQFWRGSAWVTAVNQGYNAVISMEIIDTLNNPKRLEVRLNDAAANPFSSTPSEQVGPFGPDQTNELSEFQKDKEKQYSITNDDGEVITVNGDDIMKLSDGKLTTMYHYLKNSNKVIEEVLEDTKFEDIKID